jgi:hypothetical protein
VNKKGTSKLSSPLQITKESFINGSELKKAPPLYTEDKGRVRAITFTLYSSDIETLEIQIDRATTLDKRNKSRSVIIRMALRALQESSDGKYLDLYDKF